MLNQILAAHGLYTAPGGIEYSPVTGPVTLYDKQGVIADTSAGSFAVTLPLLPGIGTQVFVHDGDDWSINNLTVHPNGQKIESFAVDEPLILDVGGIGVQFIFSGVKWKVHVQAGAYGGSAVTTTSSQTLSNKTLLSTILSGNSALDGNLNITGSGRRITGNFGGAVHSGRVMFQSATPGDYTVVGAIPAVGGTTGQFNTYSSSDPDNATMGQFSARGLEVSFVSSKTGTATYRPMTFETGGLKQMTLDTTGNLSLGAVAPIDPGTGRKYLALKGSGTAVGEGSGALQFQTNGTVAKWWNLGNIEWTIPGNSGLKRAAFIAAFAYGDVADNLGTELQLATKKDGEAGNGTPRVAISHEGHLLPMLTNAYNLGSANNRWRNIYTQDLHLSNGIGDYTVVEGEEDLYLVNNKNGKHFKFALIEVDPQEVPAKSEAARAS